MKEVVYSVEQFKAKADLTKGVHHHGMYECKDPHGIVHWLTFRIFGVSKNGNHVIIFEDKHKITIWDVPDNYKQANMFARLDAYLKDRYHELAEKYAKPLGSTEGEWKD